MKELCKSLHVIVAMAIAFANCAFAAEPPAAELRAIAQRLEQIADRVDDRPDPAAWLQEPESVDRSKWAKRGTLQINWPGTRQQNLGRDWILAPVRDGWTLERTVLLSGPRYGAGIHKGTPMRVFRNHAYRQIEIRPARPFVAGDADTGTNWGVRLYNTSDLAFEDAWVHGINSNSGEGHGLYIDPSGPMTLRRLRIEDCGGQAVQVMNREWGSHLGAGPAFASNLPFEEGLILLQDVLVRNVGWNPGRGAFALTFRGLGPKADLTIERADIEIEWSQPQMRSGRQCRSAGGIVVASADVLGFPEGARYARRVTIRDSRVVMTEPRQPILQVDNVESLTVERCHFEGGDVHLDRPGHQVSGRIVWKNNTGDGRVFHKGKLAGRASDDFEI